MTTVQTIEAGNKTLEILHDDCAQSPREWDNLGTIVAWHRNYNLSEENYSDVRSFLEEKTYHHYETEEGHEEATDTRLMDLIEKENIILPLYMYEHGQVALSTSSFHGRALHAEWDSGQVGWIYVSKEKIREEYSVRRITKKIIDKVEGILASEIDVYSNYVNGNVYGYVLKENDEEVDSCWGFYGYDFQNNGMADDLPQEIVEQL